jgi:hypothetical protein
MSLAIELREGIAVFSPGASVEGEVAWRLAEPPAAVTLRLFWRTEGTGNEDVEVVESVAFDGPAAADRRAFSLRLPPGPWSFHGPLIHLLWGLELIAEPGEESARVDLTVAPGGREIELQRATDPVEAKAEKMASGCLAIFGKTLPRRPPVG